MLSHTSLNMWLLIRTGIQVNPYKERGPPLLFRLHCGTSVVKQILGMPMINLQPVAN